MNDFTFTQSATILNNIVEQATGQAVIGNISTPQDFVAVAQTALKTGLDPILNAVSQVWSRTIFSVRDYRSPLNSLYWDLPRYGNAIRKISPVAGDMENDQKYAYPVTYDSAQNPANGDGGTVDMYEINKQDVIQTNFYGSAVYQQAYTIFRQQFECAFNSPEEFGRFMAMNMTERNNDKESYQEGIARGLQANFIGGILAENNSDRVIHLLTEYNTLTGLALTAQTVYQPGNFEAFIKWVYARIRGIVREFGFRSQKYQTVINGKPVLRHARPEDVRIALYAPAMDKIDSMVRASTYHEDILDIRPNWEAIGFWQSIDTPDSIAVQPVYTSTTGTVTTTESETEQAGIFGLIHDKDAIGYAITQPEAAVTPYNAKGSYWNEFYHATFKTISDNTEKACVLLLD